MVEHKQNEGSQKKNAKHRQENRKEELNVQSSGDIIS